VLTDAEHAAMQQTDQIFQLGEKPARVIDAASTPVVRSRYHRRLAKLVVHRLLSRRSCTSNLRLLCHESSKTCWANLALLSWTSCQTHNPRHKPDIKLYNHSIGRYIAWYAQTLACEPTVPCLAELPVLLPTGLAPRAPVLDHWFDQRVVPRIVGGGPEEPYSHWRKRMGNSPPNGLHDDLLTNYRCETGPLRRDHRAVLCHRHEKGGITRGAARRRP
jgi:LysR family transcriptional activator of nhaA